MATIIAYIQSLSFKSVNFLFGKTAIFIIIIGWYLVITGLLFLTKPQKARDKLAGTGYGIAKANLLLACFLLWGLISGLSQKLPGMTQAIVFWGGLTGLIILYLKLRSLAKNKLAALAGRLPLQILIWFAWGQVIIGGLMVYLQHRLW